VHDAASEGDINVPVDGTPRADDPSDSVRNRQVRSEVLVQRVNVIACDSEVK
jgi:hypothetical protein